MYTILAFDFGVKKMGIAVGNTLTDTAEPLTIVSMNNGQPDWDALLVLITEWQPVTILVGLPLNMDDSPSHLSKRATKFAKRLSHKLKEIQQPKDMYLVDERLTSFIAKQDQKDSKKHIDDHSACLLITTWFDDQTGQLVP